MVSSPQRPPECKAQRNSCAAAARKSALSSNMRWICASSCEKSFRRKMWQFWGSPKDDIVTSVLTSELPPTLPSSHRLRSNSIGGIFASQCFSSRSADHLSASPVSGRRLPAKPATPGARRSGLGARVAGSGEIDRLTLTGGRLGMVVIRVTLLAVLGRIGKGAL